MHDATRLRAVITGLLGFAAAEEETLLAEGAEDGGDGDGGGGDGGGGGPHRWAAVPLLAHTTEFKSQQAERIRALRSGQTPPVFGEIDHSSPSVYAEYASRPGTTWRQRRSRSRSGRAA